MIGKIVVFIAFVALSLAQQQFGTATQYTKPEQPKYPPQPYNFAYESKDENGTMQFRKESGDSDGRVSGSYGYKDEQGVERTVEYVADENGYRAQIKTNEPGTENKSPANVEWQADPIVLNYVLKPRQQNSIIYAAPAQPVYGTPQKNH